MDSQGETDCILANMTRAEKAQLLQHIVRELGNYRKNWRNAKNKRGFSIECILLLKTLIILSL